MKKMLLLPLCAVVLVGLAGCVGSGRVGNAKVPQPARVVDVSRYSGLWYEVARYDNSFERGCEAVTAQYSAKPDGTVRVLNTCREGSPSGPARTSEGSARIVEGSENAKFKVSFFGPLYVGNYWILDRAPDYSWSIVGEPSGRYLWLLSRTKSKSALRTMKLRARELGYDTSLLRVTRH